MEIEGKIVGLIVFSVFFILGALSIFKTKAMYEYFHQSYVNQRNNFQNIPILSFITTLNLKIFEETGYIFLRIWGFFALILSILGIFAILFGPIQL